MSENSKGESFNSSNNQNLDPKKPIYDELVDIFANQTENNPEKIVNPLLARLAFICDELDRVRGLELVRVNQDVRQK